MTITTDAADIFRDMEAPGSDTPHEPEKPRIRTLFADIDQTIQNVAQAGSGAYIIKETEADLNADLDHDAGVYAEVIADDQSPPENGFYVKVGASGGGSWSFVAPNPAKASAQEAQDAAAAAAASEQAAAEWASEAEAAVAGVTNLIRLDGGERTHKTWESSDGKAGASFLKETDKNVEWDLEIPGYDLPVMARIDEFISEGEESAAREAVRVNSGVMRSMFETERNRSFPVAEIYFNSILKPDGSDGTETQRIPGLVVLSPTTAFMAWQQRLTGYGYDGDAQYQRLVGCLVTYTPGVGVSAGATVVIDEPANPIKVSNHPHMFLNADGDIVLLYNNNEHGTGTGQYKVYRRVSSDNGATWSAREEVAAPIGGGVSLALGSNGTVVQVPVGYETEGRWLVPVYGDSNDGYFSGVIYSDDDGVTWEDGPLLRNGLQIQEPSIAETHEGDVLMAMRRADDPYLVHFARIPFDATEWIDMGLNPQMVTATCDMSMVQVAPLVGDGVPAIAHCGPSIVARRANRIRMSYDCGRTWQWSFKRPDVPDTAGNGAGYTSIKMLDRGLFIVAYETAESSADDSDIGVYVVNIEKVLNDGERL